MDSILTGISDNIVESPLEIGSLLRSLNNCVESREAGNIMSKMDVQELYALCFKIVESIEVTVTGEKYNNIAYTIWNILCWLRDSMWAMMYLKFDASDMVVHDLNVVPIYQIITKIQLKMVDIFEENSKHYEHAIRYLSVLNNILIEKGVP